MPDSEREQETRNRSIVSELRETFAPMTERLTPETEPAVIYQRIAPASEAQTGDE